VLLGFLEEFSESIKQEEESCNVVIDDDEASLASVVSSSPASPLMVGPTSTELESINELIRFDHVYVKSAQQQIQQTPTTHHVTKPVGVAPRPMVSVLRRIQPKITATPPIMTTTINNSTVKKEQKEEDNVVKSSASDTPLNLHLGEMDLEALSESIEGLVDFDTMFKELVQAQDNLTATPVDLSTTSRDITPVDLSTTSRDTTYTSSSNSLKRKSLNVPEFDAKKVKSEDLKINLSVEASYQPILTTPDPAESGYMFDFDSSIGHTSGYISDDACSPKSDDSGLLENNLHWEDQSFSELFPALC